MASAFEVCGKVPPQCISGRWGMITRCETYCLKGTPLHFRTVFMKVLLAKGKNKPTAFSTQADESREEYREQLSRWSKEAMEAIDNDDFWLIMRISLRSRKALDHLLYYVEERSTRNLADCLKRMTRLAGLVNGKAEEIQSEVRKLDTQAYADILEDMPASAALDKYNDYQSCLLKLSCAQAADYDHRIMSRVKGFSAPAQLLALVKESAGIVCPVRRDLCRRLLQADAKDLHLTVLKLRTVFYEEVQD